MTVDSFKVTHNDKFTQCETVQMPLLPLSATLRCVFTVVLSFFTDSLVFFNLSAVLCLSALSVLSAPSAAAEVVSFTVTAVKTVSVFVSVLSLQSVNLTILIMIASLQNLQVLHTASVKTEENFTEKKKTVVRTLIRSQRKCKTVFNSEVCALLSH